MLENRFRWLAVIVAALSVNAAGCLSDDGSSETDGPDRADGGGGRPNGGGGDGDDDNPSLDVGIEEDAGGGGDEDAGGGGGGGGEEPAVDCDAIPDGENLGTECSEATGADFCGDGGICVTPPDAETSICAQICFPDVCDDVCGGGQVCIGVSDANDDPILVDTDGDGTDETAIGACADVPTGDTPNFGVCDAENRCGANVDCLVESRDATEGICFPQCDSSGECPDNGVCVLQTSTGGDPTHCLATCEDTENSSDCPDGFQCAAVQGGSVCALPSMISGG